MVRLARILLAPAVGVVLAAGAPVAVAACPDETLIPSPDNLPRVAAAVVCLHNEERRAAGVKPLREEQLLARTSGQHSADMVARRYFGFVTPEGDSPFRRLVRAGYARGKVWTAGENIAWGTGTLSTPRRIIDGWMRSYGRRLTLLASDFDEVGVGISLGAPSGEHAARTDAVTYTVDYGWRPSSGA
jgi:uncharacterized protein YkwD